MEDIFDSDVDYQMTLHRIYEKTGVGKWNKGGVLSMKREHKDRNWENIVIDNIGPVTTAVTRLPNNKTHESALFGGRYYYEIEDNVDDADSCNNMRS
jgi:hypothetical protein